MPSAWWRLTQGRASFPTEPSAAWMTPEEVLRALRPSPVPPRSRDGSRRTWASREYFQHRVPVTVEVHRIVVFADDRSAEPSEVLGAPVPGPPASRPPCRRRGPPQRAAHGGSAEAAGEGRAPPGRLHRRRGLPDGPPRRRPARREGPGRRPAARRSHQGGRQGGRASPAGFSPRCVEQGSVVLTGWLEVGDEGARYAPHTAGGYALPGSRFLFHLGGALTAKWGYRQAIRAGHVRDGVWQRGAETASS
ncbi:MAG: hypothetical protein U5R31_15025 [Acidimicrobiia bacterium]|nr:hypothetical protein [Acidimicrobiia bacterium]